MGNDWTGFGVVDATLHLIPLGAGNAATDAFSDGLVLSLVNLEDVLLRGDATKGFAFGLKGARSGDLNGLCRASLRRRRFAVGGVAIEKS